MSYFFRCLARSAINNFRIAKFNQSQAFSTTTNEVDLKISDACVERLSKIAEKGQFLRVTVDGGGCYGFQYRFDLDDKLNDDDDCFEKNGVKIVVDKISIPFLKGSTIDYHEGLMKTGFRITDIPQAENRCSCGSSFAVKMS